MHDFERLTSAGLRQLVERGVTTAIVPFGSVEYQDDHLPLGADAILADAVGREVARRLDALLLPTFRVGHAPAHQKLAGTLTIKSQTLTDIAFGVCQSLARNRIRTIALISTHGGNAAPLDAALERVGESRVDAVICAPHGDLGRAPGTHSGEWLTSVMLVLAPQLVDLAAASGGLSGASAEAGRRHLDRFVSSLVDGVRSAIQR